MCSKHVAVITKNDIWYTGKLDNDEEGFISLDDVDLILIYLGKNVFRATKPKPVLIHHTPAPEVKSPSQEDTNYVHSKVYEPESALPRQHTWSMGSPTNESDTEPASEGHSSPQQPLRSQNLIGVDIRNQHKLLLSRKSSEFIEEPDIQKKRAPYVGKNLSVRKI